MKAILDLRRTGILLRKRFQLLTYNMKLKFRQGDSLDAVNQPRSLNLLDFQNNRQKDLFLVDPYSDATQYGGMTETQLDVTNGLLEIKSKFVPDQTGLVPVDYLFSGFRCLNLVKQNFEHFNGFRITLIRPRYPLKFGVYLKTSLKEYEHFVAHIVDTGAGSETVSYEIPVSLMVNDNIKNQLVRAQASDQFDVKGLTLTAQSPKKSMDLDWQILRIDAVYNPDYEKVFQIYKIPVMFQMTEQGIHNGRQSFAFQGEQQQKKQSINALSYDSYDPVQSFKSIKDKLK